MIRLLLLLGVSGAGKTTLVHELKKIDDRFMYISPFVTRPLRIGETEKVHVSEKQLLDMNSKGKVIMVNDKFGNMFAVPRKPIDYAFNKGKFPILDWPLDCSSLFEGIYPNRLCRVYIEPPSLLELKQRLDSDGRDANGYRFKAAVAELEELLNGSLEGRYDVRIVNTNNNVKAVAAEVYRFYLSAIIT